MDSVFAGKNCAKNLHACQWERAVLLGITIFLFLLNVAQLGYTHRAKLFRLMRRGAERIPDDGDEQPILIRRD